MEHSDFWLALDQLVATHPLRIDRPKGSAHPRYPTVIYPVDYGFLEGTTSSDGGGMDIWVGSLPGRKVTGIVCAVDQEKYDAEVKVLLGCTAAEARQVLAFHNRGSQAAVLMERRRPSPVTRSSLKILALVSIFVPLLVLALTSSLVSIVILVSDILFRRTDNIMAALALVWVGAVASVAARGFADLEVRVGKLEGTRSHDANVT